METIKKVLKRNSKLSSILESDIEFIDVDADSINFKNKRAISYSLISLADNEQKLLDYLRGIKEQSVAYTYGSVMHSMFSNTFDFNRIEFEDYISIDDEVFLSMHSVSEIVLMKEKMMQNRFYMSVVKSNPHFELKKYKILKYRNYRFILKAYIDCYDSKSNRIIEFKTTSRNINQSIPLKYYVLKQYKYDIQSYLYSNMMNKAKFYFIFLNKQTFDIHNFEFKYFQTTVIRTKELIDKFIEICDKHQIIDKFTL